MIEGARLAPYVAVQKHLGLTYAWMDCDKCLSSCPESSRRAMLCGYVPRDKWIGNGHGTTFVPGSPISHPEICPGYSTNLPPIREVADAWVWFSKGQMQLVHPEPSELLTDLVSLFNEAMSGAQAYLSERRREDRK